MLKVHRAVNEPELAGRGEGWLAALFHENTKLTGTDLAEHAERIAAFGRHVVTTPAGPDIAPAAKKVRLPGQHGIRMLDRLIRRRRTIRQFGSRPMSLAALGRVLFNASGITAWTSGDSDIPPLPLHSTPSAGALYPIELRLAGLNVRGLDEGIYRYQPGDHHLELLQPGVGRDALARASLHPDLVSASGVVLAMLADGRQLIHKYGDRGYRFALLEAGHMAQNVLLTCAASRLAAVPLGGFLDDDAAAVFAANGSPLQLLYLIAVGRRSAGKSR